MDKSKKVLMWLSYSDLITSLFFIMLVLFVIVFARMNKQIIKLRKAEEIKAAVSNLESQYFTYDPMNKRHELKVDVLFESGRDEIPVSNKADLLYAGKELRDIVVSNKYQDFDVKYLVIIEGMAAKYTEPESVWKNSDPDYIDRVYNLSYNRAKSLYNLWKSHGIEFDENIFEIILAGSGWNGAGRYSQRKEGLNKRFLIQIIPKIGKINMENIGKRKPNFSQISDKELKGSECAKNLSGKMDVGDTKKIIAKLFEERINLIPIKRVAGGKPFYTKIEVFMENCLIYAEFEDGHSAGRSVFQFQIDESGMVNFKLMEYISE